MVNITGLSNVSRDLSDKRLELFKEIVPKLSQLAVLKDLTNLSSEVAVKDVMDAAHALRLQLRWFELKNSEDLETTLSALRSSRPDGLFNLGGPLTNRNRKKLIEFTLEVKMPASFHRREFVEAGALFSYDANPLELDRRAAVYVDKILKGAKPTESFRSSNRLGLS